VCEYAYLDNNQNVIIHATPNYYGQASFSDIYVEMDESEQENYLTDNGLCYAKVLYINYYDHNLLSNYKILILFNFILLF
jgi:hypothetical protein